MTRKNDSDDKSESAARLRKIEEWRREIARLENRIKQYEAMLEREK